MSDYKYKTFKDVASAIFAGELDDFKLDIDYDCVHLMRKNGAMTKEDFNIWRGCQPDVALRELVQGLNISLNGDDNE